MTLLLAGELELTPAAASELLAAYPFATLKHYDLGPSSGTDQVGPAEIGRLIVMEPLSKAVATTFIERGAAAPWHLLPIDVRLEDADPERDLYWRAAELFDFFTKLPGVADAIASKLLHLKRPGFFPILDSIVRNLYDAAAKDAYEASLRAKHELPTAHRLYWGAIRRDLIDDGNREAFDAVRTLLRADERPTVNAIAALTTVRLLDMLAWQERVSVARARRNQPSTGR